MSRRRVLRQASVAGTLAGAGLLGVSSADDHHDDDPEYRSDRWYEREQSNYARTKEAPQEQASDPSFQRRWNEQTTSNELEYRQRMREETEWNYSGNSCRRWTTLCVGDPFLYPEDEPLWSGDSFYEDTGQVQRVAFYDSGLDQDEGGARLNGRVWAPIDAEPGDQLPGVVITDGSIQATETYYWWAAQSLVSQGYVVMTYDPRGQGRSDNETPDGTEGGNFESSVFVTNQVDAIDHFRSTPDDPYPHNTDDVARADDDVAPVIDYNPFHEFLDRDRIGIAGHSLGAYGASIVQGMAWPEMAKGEENPVDVAVAWDNLSAAGRELAGRTVTPRVPTMGQSADYGIAPTPHTSPPDPEANNDGFNSWRDAGVPTYQVNVRGGTHMEWSLVPTLPATSWESWGNEMAEHFTVAWFDFWLKERGEPGYEDAEFRLLQEDPWTDRMSFYYTSARYFPEHRHRDTWDRGQSSPERWHRCEDIRDGC